MATIDYKQLATPEANLIELLSAQNQDGTYSAKLMGSEPFAVLAAKTIYNAYNDIEDNMAADVEGPASSTDNALARFDGTTGKLLQNSNAILTDAGALSLASNLTVSGTGTSSFAGNVAVTGTGTSYTAVDTGSFVKIGNDQTGANLQLGSKSGAGAILQGAATGVGAYALVAQPYGGNFLLGTTTDGGQKLQVVGQNSTGFVSATDYSNGDAGQFIARGSRGTPSAPTAQNASDSTGLLRMYGYDGSSFIENARIYAQTAGTIATNRVGGVLSFWTHPDSTSAIAEAMRITQAQNLLLGTTTDVGPRLLSKAKDNTYAGAGIGIVDQSAGTSYITRSNGTFYISNNGSTDHFALDASGNATFAGTVSISKANPELAIRSASDAAGQIQYLTFGSPTYNRSQIRVTSAGTSDGSIALYTFNAGSPVLSQTWDKDGNATFAGAVTVSGADKVLTVTSSASTPGFTMRQTGGIAANRNWGIVINNSANGDFILRRSTTTSGDPTTAVLTFDSTGDATFAKKMAINGAALTYDFNLRASTSNTGSTVFRFEQANGTEILAIRDNGTAIFAGDIRIGNTVQTAAGVSSTHKVTISIGGTTYYLLATNV